MFNRQSLNNHHCCNNLWHGEQRRIEYVFSAQQIEEAWRRMQRLTHATSYPKPYDISYLESIERCHPVRRDIVVFSSVSRSSNCRHSPAFCPLVSWSHGCGRPPFLLSNLIAAPVQPEEAWLIWTTKTPAGALASCCTTMTPAAIFTRRCRQAQSSATAAAAARRSCDARAAVTEAAPVASCSPPR